MRKARLSRTPMESISVRKQYIKERVDIVQQKPDLAASEAGILRYRLYFCRWCGEGTCKNKKSHGSLWVSRLRGEHLWSLKIPFSPNLIDISTTHCQFRVEVIQYCEYVRKVSNSTVHQILLQINTL